MVFAARDAGAQWGGRRWRCSDWGKRSPGRRNARRPRPRGPVVRYRLLAEATRKPACPAGVADCDGRRAFRGPAREFGLPGAEPISVGSRTASRQWRRCPRRPGACCWWSRRRRPASRWWYSRPPGGSISRPRPRGGAGGRRCWTHARRSGSGIRCCVRRFTGRRGCEAAGGAPGPGRGDRPSGPIGGLGIGPRPRRGRMRRWPRSWSGQAGPGAGPGRHGRGGGVPGARGRVDERTWTAIRARSGGRGGGSAAARWMRRPSWSLRRRRDRWMTSSGRAPTCCAGGSHSSQRRAATLRACCWRRPGNSSRWMARSRVRHTWTRGVAALLPASARAPGTLHDVCRAARSAPPPAGAPRPSDLLLDGLAVLVTEGRAQAGPVLRRAARVFAEEEIAQEEGQRWGWGGHVWPRSWCGRRSTTTRWWSGCSNSPREAGLLVDLPMWVQATAIQAVWRGDFTAAASLIAEADAIAAVTGAARPATQPSCSPVSAGQKPMPVRRPTP